MHGSSIQTVYGTVRSVADHGVDALCGLAGRARVVRAARFVLHRSRLDLPNNPHTNGEFALQRWVLDAVAPADPLTAFDVGANVGRWSQRLLQLAGRAGHRLDLHAFEPAGYSYRRLAENLPPAAQVNRLALSDRSGARTLHVIRPGAGRNSLHHQEGTAPATEPVATTTVDDYRAGSAVDHIDLLKIDTEGHDFPVLRGAERSFRGWLISVAQFEYGPRWVHSRYYLKDVFDLLEPYGYRIGKLTPAGVEFYPGWDPDLETFVEGNYVVCTEAVARRLPRVRWWKSSGGNASCGSG